MAFKTTPCLLGVNNAEDSAETLIESLRCLGEQLGLKDMKVFFPQDHILDIGYYNCIS